MPAQIGPKLQALLDSLPGETVDIDDTVEPKWTDATHCVITAKPQAPAVHIEHLSVVAEPDSPVIDSTCEVKTIHPEVDAICEKLGVPSNLVTKLEIEPVSTTVHMFTPDEHGRPHVVDGAAVRETRTFGVTG